jgi:HD superfamily phosphodiesterase
MKDVDLIALAGLLHDIGKFGQRGKLEKDEGNLDLYCPFRKNGGYFTHQHALFTVQIIDDFEKIGL